MKLKFKLKKRRLVLLVIAFITILFFKTSDKKQFYTATSNQSEVETPLSTHKTSIGVEISGAIQNPGYYDIAIDLRINDLINIAGGVVDANQECYNLASHLSDGQKIIIKPSTSPCEQLQTININTADNKHLESIVGIGPKKASDIIAYRNLNGPFVKIEDIQLVSGIGPATFIKIKDSINI